MFQAQTMADLRTRRGALSGTVALVPTMGALHAGHEALVKAAKAMADHVIVSVFVNPTQFGPHEDFAKYPRPLQRDLEACAAGGAAGVFVPSVQEMYPPEDLACAVNIPALADILEGAQRPGHFAGVCRVVAKLLNLAQPDVACFGQKDLQQLRVIQAMARDLAMPVRIIGLPTVRQEDGLALSSRNAYLDAAQRKRAVGLHKALRQAEYLIVEQGESEPAAVERTMREVIQAHQFDAIDYAVVRHPRYLSELDVIEPGVTGGVAALVAARMGATRLLDNLLIAAPSDVLR
jgi:pantoate--beta-alanine ligase